MPIPRGRKMVQGASDQVKLRIAEHRSPSGSGQQFEVELQSRSQSGKVHSMNFRAQTQDVIERFNDAFNRYDVENVMECVTDDIIFENSSGGRFEGREAVRAVLSRAFALMAPGAFELEELFAADNRCVVRWRYHFKRGAPAQAQVRGVDIFSVREGRVAEKFSYVKSAEFVQQLGLQLPVS